MPVQKVLVKDLSCCTNLKTLYLQENLIGDEGAIALADGLANCKKLKSLHLDINNISSIGVIYIIVKKICLDTLSFRNNCIGEECTAALTDGLHVSILV